MYALLGGWGAFTYCLAWALHRPLIKTRIRGFKNAFIVRRDDSDIIVLHEVFVHHGSNVDLSWTPRYILDGGANTEFVAAMYARRYPGARILAVEPGTTNAGLIRRNCAEFPNIEVIEAGIWARSANLEIENPQDMSYGFRVREVPQPTPNSFRGLTIAELADRFGPGAIIDICKLDIEGTERELMRGGWESWIDRVRCIVVELHGQEARDLAEQFIKLRPFTVSRSGEKVVLINEALVPAPALQTA